jgi:hypothetical protein
MTNNPLALNLSSSPIRGRSPFKTPKKENEKKPTFPTTPRSVEKQKKMLQARLKRLME